MLFDLTTELSSRGIQLVAANPSDRVAAIFERSGLLDALGAPPPPRPAASPPPAGPGHPHGIPRRLLGRLVLKSFESF